MVHLKGGLYPLAEELGSWFGMGATRGGSAALVLLGTISSHCCSGRPPIRTSSSIIMMTFQQIMAWGLIRSSIPSLRKQIDRTTDRIVEAIISASRSCCESRWACSNMARSRSASPNPERRPGPSDVDP